MKQKRHEFHEFKLKQWWDVFCCPAPGWEAENTHPTRFVKFGALLSMMSAFATTYDRTYICGFLTFDQILVLSYSTTFARILSKSQVFL
jgi:hypothetical protein